MESSKTTIGRNVLIDFVGHATQVPAKVDTGADSSSVWASNVTINPDGNLFFTLFDKESPFYDGKVIEAKDYNVAYVRSSTGHEQIRYRVVLSVRIKGRRIKAAFNLSDRSRNNVPVLIGCRTLSGKFVVDVTAADIKSFQTTGKVTQLLNDELKRNPLAFYKKYHGKDI